MSVLVAREAPDFIAEAVMPDGTIKDKFSLSDLRGTPTVLFFWPFDFTFVCPTEIIAHDHRMAEFKERGVNVVGISIDSKHTHFAWRNTPINEGGIGPVQFPIVADVSHDITRAYDVEHPDDCAAMRASFLIDKDGIVQHQVVNNLPLGRNVDEMLRMVDAMQFHEKHGEVCPAGWQKGDDTMQENAAAVASYLSKNAENL